jgi:hypothetical protein
MMTEIVFVSQKIDPEGPWVATIKIRVPAGLTPGLFDPCATLAEFESALDDVERDLTKARSQARKWFASRTSN